MTKVRFKTKSGKTVSFNARIKMTSGRGKPWEELTNKERRQILRSSR
jgi:hypothetical protein